MKKQILIFLSMLVVLFTSCESLIDENSSVIYEKSRTYQSKEDVMASLYGGYTLLQSSQLYGGNTVHALADEAADEIRTTSGANSYTGYNFSSTLGLLLNWWRGNYTLIGATNDFISNIDRVNSSIFNDDQKHQLKAEMKFLRALGYYNLVIAFGRVPLILAMPTDLSEVTYPTRVPLNEVYKSIISDLQDAESYLPVANTANQQDGRATRGAAAALLAKVYLTKGNSSAAEPSDFQNAADLCDDIISGNYGIYDLLSNYADVFNPDYEGSKEHLFSVKFDIVPNVTGNLVYMYSPNTLYNTPPVGVKYPSYSLINSFDQLNDKRFKYGFKNKNPLTGAWLHSTHRNFFTKYQDAKKDPALGDRCDLPIIRFSDVLLMHSEALHVGNIVASKSGKDKYYGINRVRDRARETTITGTCKLLDLSADSYTGDFLDIIVQERAWEFNCECQRRWDLLRTQKLIPVMTAYFLYEVNYGLPVKTVKPENVLFPLPLQEVETNKNLIPVGELNNGYIDSSTGDDTIE